jgi:hypothetical protein
MLGDAVPSLQWIDTTNPPWLGQSSVMGTLDTFWLDTTNPPYMTATGSSSPAPQGTSASLISAHWLDTTLLLQKVSEDDENKDKELTLRGTSGTRLGSFVCPVILPSNNKYKSMIVLIFILNRDLTSIRASIKTTFVFQPTISIFATLLLTNTRSCRQNDWTNKTSQSCPRPPP